MAITRAKKEEIVKVLEDNLKNLSMLVFVNFRGLSVADVSEFRRKLRQAGAEYVVAKKTLARLVLKEKDIEMPMLEGEVGFVFGHGDPITTAKEVQTFGKEHAAVKIAGGVFESKVIDADMVIRLAKIPPREVLLAQVVGLLNSPMSGLVRVLNGNQRKLVIALKQIAEQKN